RANYISLRRLRGAQQRMLGLLAEASTQDQLLTIGRWAKQTADGSRSDLDFQPSPVVWDLVESDGGNCLGRQCPNYAECFYFKARRQVYTANLLIVNHALFFTDLALRRHGAGILPEYQVAILDEAHTVEDGARDPRARKTPGGAVKSLPNNLYPPRHNRGLLAYFGTAATQRQVEIARNAADQFFGSILAWHTRQPRNTGRVRTPQIVGD